MCISVERVCVEKGREGGKEAEGAEDGKYSLLLEGLGGWGEMGGWGWGKKTTVACQYYDVKSLFPGLC